MTASKIVVHAARVRRNIRRRLTFQRRLRSERSKNKHKSMVQHLATANKLLCKAATWQQCFQACATNNNRKNVARLVKTVLEDDEDDE